MKTLKNLALTFVICILATATTLAHEGMWIPSTLAKLVAGDMQDAGLKLEPEDIYAINHSSIKDAIVHFGGGCTAEVISDAGLILTNHHCGYGQIQAHSSLQNDYLTHGFWAMDRSAELPNDGLTATFVKRIEDVTAQINAATKNLSGADRDKALAAEIARLQGEATKGTHYEAEVKPFFYGNAWYMIVTETFRDVRLVGAPPSSIGKFGGDTDNWMWPRHTGDFSLFRIYASAENLPADYSPENVPYQPAYSLPISMDGVREGDFTMVFGFPGYTQQYLTSYAVQQLVDVENPAKIAMRKASLGVIDAAMAADAETRIKYAAKQSRISNAYKKWIGQNMGLKRFDAVGVKQALEAKFVEKASATEEYKQAAGLLPAFSQLYSQYQPYQMSRAYLIEYYYYGPEILRFSTAFGSLVENYDSLASTGALQPELERLEKVAAGFYKNYDAEVDQAVFAALTPLFTEQAPDILQSATLKTYQAKNSDDALAFAESVYEKSVFDNADQLQELLRQKPKKLAKTISADPIYKIANQLLDNYRKQVSPGYATFAAAEDSLMRLYVQAQLELFPDETYWPDANSTMRLTYGQMEGSQPEDGLIYKPYTTLQGVVRKYIPGDTEFDLPAKLIELYQNRDFGPYATDGELRVCFLGSNHTTGGNSGSPALNAYGQLVGLNFDRTWESTMSDIMFNGEICRNIMVDIKYVLFIIDKYAGAHHLIEEMELVSSERP